MTFQEQERNGVMVIQLGGALDLLTARDFRLMWERLQERDCHRIVLDLAGVDFIDSQSLAIIISQAIHCRKLGGDVKVAAVQPQILRVFELVRMKDVLDFHDDPELAVQSFSPSA
ncbi:MAG: STAS domain-containing protein [Candidatus Riflebacteria bacterium]|nr:STAS domain-containing protein [Candidatus Riflebacteria bacterium]